jgi:hypothetical protein
MITVTMDKSAVPQDLHDNPNLLLAEAWVCKRMENRRYRTRTAVHEAGHAIYGERAGAVRVYFTGPYAVYDAEARSFPIHEGRCRTLFSGLTAVQAPDALMAFARMGVAGRIAVKRLLGKDEKTDESDFRVFQEMATTMLGANEQEIADSWERAKKDVEEDFDDPDFRQQVWKRAKEAEPQLCGSESLNAPGAQPDFGFNGYSPNEFMASSGLPGDALLAAESGKRTDTPDTVAVGSLA